MIRRKCKTSIASTLLTFLISTHVYRGLLTTLIYVISLKAYFYILQSGVDQKVWCFEQSCTDYHILGVYRYQIVCISDSKYFKLMNFIINFTS